MSASGRAGFDWRAPHGVVLRVMSNSLRAFVDDEPVMEVPDLAEAARRAGSPYAPPSGGRVGLRLWHTTDLSIDSVRVTRT